MGVYLVLVSFFIFSSLGAAGDPGDLEKRERRVDFKVIDKHCRDFPLVEKVFNTTISKWYGVQEYALKRLSDGEDRLCEMLFENDVPRGIIVFKKKLQSRTLECKTLCLLNPEKDSGKGYGKMLLARLLANADQRLAASVGLSVSSSNSAKDFFIKSGFRFTEEVLGRYKEGESECFFTYALPAIASSGSLPVPVMLTSYKARDSEVTDRRSASGSVPVPVPVMLTSYKARDSEVTDRSDARSTEGFASGSDVMRQAGMVVSDSCRRIDLKCTLRREYVNAIRSGRKTFEGRVATSYFAGYVPGKLVEWFSGTGDSDKVITEIVSRRKFGSFTEMLRTVGHKKFLPEVGTMDEACRLYDSIPNYAEKAKTFGALALELKVVTLPSAPVPREASFDASRRWGQGDSREELKRKTETESECREERGLEKRGLKKW